MPIPNEYRDICEMLLDATKDGRVTWIETASGSFAVRLPEFSLEIWSGTDERDGEFVAIGLKDPKGRGLVDNWFLEEADQDFNFLKTLCAAAQRQARNVPQRLEILRELLRRGERIGLDDDETS